MKHVLALLLLSGCASGPQLVPVTTPQTTTITFEANDGGTVYVGSFWLTTSGEVKPVTTGLDVRSNVNATANVPISTGGATSTGASETGTAPAPAPTPRR